MGAKLPSTAARGRRAPMADINVTPLVDVMLVLLIIFMVTAPLLTAGVPVNLPDSRARPLEQEQAPVDMAIDGEGRVYVGDVDVSATLPEALATIASRAPADRPPQVLLRAERSIDYGRVAGVMGELNRAGLNRIALVTNVGSGGPE